MRLFLFAIAVLVLYFIISGGYMFYVACRRGKEMPWLDDEALKNTPYEKYTQHISAAHRWLQQHKAQDIYTESEDGLKLHALWVPAEKPAGTILLAHGYRSCRLVDFGMVFELYHNLGMNLLLPDQRAHGQSEGKWITFGVKECRDMLCWLDFHNRKFGHLPVILSGLSMGASTMLFLADEDLPQNVKGMITDCGFSSPKEILSVVFKRVMHVPAGASLWVCDLCARLVAGFSIYGKDSRKTLKKNTLPILMVHGVDDDFVPCYMTEQGFAACTGEKQMMLVEKAGHGVSFLVESQRYKETVMQFLKTNLRR